MLEVQLAVRETLTQTAVRYHPIRVKMAAIKNPSYQVLARM